MLDVAPVEKEKVTEPVTGRKDSSGFDPFVMFGPVLFLQEGAAFCAGSC